MPIKVLTSEVTSQIAAGEVIERPSSVVKELLDNSLDAASHHIRIDIRAGGIELIRVSDDGEGIPSAELELAFSRYATSKISRLDDLEEVSSLGFRGEALPSIAAVSEIELCSRVSEESTSSVIKLRGGTVIHREKHSRSRGTTIEIHRLFHNFPARLKFLRTPNTESNRILHLVGQYALGFPEIQFGLFIDGHISLQTAGDGSLFSAISKVYGLEVARKMLEVKVEEAAVCVTGATSSLSLTRSNRSYLSFFVNRRWVQSPLLSRATEQAYHSLLIGGKHPVSVLNIMLPHREVDINVHPAKMQVRFRYEQAVFASVEKAVKEALSGSPVVSYDSIDSMPAQDVHRQWQNLQVRDNEVTFTAPLLPFKLPVLRVLGQVANTYIIAEGPDGLYVIDQHAAHERIRYDKILVQRARSEVEVQGLLQPLMLELGPGDSQTLKDNMSKLAPFGFTVEDFGGGSYLVHSVPVMVKDEDIAGVMRAVLDGIIEGGKVAHWEEKVAMSLACHGAIKAGQRLSDDEMKMLLKQLEETEHPRTCPHGRPTIIQMSLHQLERDFLRIG
jgi:DNA mismatch repair protein MutL